MTNGAADLPSQPPGVTQRDHLVTTTSAVKVAREVDNYYLNPYKGATVLFSIARLDFSYLKPQTVQSNHADRVFYISALG